MHARRAAVCLAVAFVVAVAGACSSGPSTHGPLREVTDGSTAGQSIQAKADTPYVLDMRDLCTTTGSQRIKKVTPWKPTSSDIRIADWGVRVDPRSGNTFSPVPTGEPGKVSQADGFSTGPVTVRCHSKSSDQRFYISVAVSRGQASMYGATVHYGDGKILNTQMTLTLCTTGPLEACNPPRSMQG